MEKPGFFPYGYQWTTKAGSKSKGLLGSTVYHILNKKLGWTYLGHRLSRGPRLVMIMSGQWFVSHHSPLGPLTFPTI